MKLPRLLTASDLPVAELHAARLDGELYSVDEAFSALDDFDTAHSRAESIARAVPSRLIAERRTAAWIHGAIAVAPARHEFCAAIGARHRSDSPSRRLVREVVIEEADVMTVSALRVTTPLRTVVDLARAAGEFTERDERVIRALMLDHYLELDQCRAMLDRRRNLPNKRVAVERLSASTWSPSAVHLM